jgi:hypothetical protein
MGVRCWEYELIFLNCPEFVQEVIRIDPDTSLAIVSKKTAFFMDDSGVEF